MLTDTLLALLLATSYAAHTVSYGLLLFFEFSEGRDHVELRRKLMISHLFVLVSLATITGCYSVKYAKESKHGVEVSQTVSNVINDDAPHPPQTRG